MNQTLTITKRKNKNRSNSWFQVTFYLYVGSFLYSYFSGISDDHKGWREPKNPKQMNQYQNLWSYTWQYLYEFTLSKKSFRFTLVRHSIVLRWKASKILPIDISCYCQCNRRFAFNFTPRWVEPVVGHVSTRGLAGEWWILLRLCMCN